MNEEQINELIKKYNDGTIEQNDRLALDIWYLKFANESISILPWEREVEMVARLKSVLPLAQKPVKIKLWPRMAIAAAVLLTVISAAVLFFNTDPSAEKFYANDKAPGKTGATLTLANGKKIYISDTDKGVIAHESGVTISKSADGKIVYELEDNASGSDGINTLQTSNGQQAQVNLPDGSTVQLNAASSLKYPFSFLGHAKRSVELFGEAFFEVSKDSKHPFVVTTGQQQVEVLGTQFNINAYSLDAPIKTTLLEGSVKIAKQGSSSKFLVPGQQASVSKGSIEVENVEVEYAVAWKKGYFLFKDENMEQIMQKLGRWYNIEPVFADQALKKKTFFGSISKFENISK
ncbi:MAG TPA: FecR domain-containing protein, partial [Pedobacter sp.]